MAGTRTGNAERDLALEHELLADPKERRARDADGSRTQRHRFVAKTGSVHVTENMTTERYSHVMHIVSNVEATLKPSRCTAVLKATFGRLLSGAPKVRAMEIIDELEPSKRGIYAGARLSRFNGDMDPLLQPDAVIKDGKLYVQAGAGIVADSVPTVNGLRLKTGRALLRAAEMAQGPPAAALVRVVMLLPEFRVEQTKKGCPKAPSHRRSGESHPSRIHNHQSACFAPGRRPCRHRFTSCLKQSHQVPVANPLAVVP